MRSNTPHRNKNLVPRSGAWVDTPPVILVALAVVAACLLWWAGPRLGSHFIGIPAVDHHGTQWFYWLVDQKWREGLAHTELLFHPWGKDLTLHSGANLLDAWLALPLRRVLGPVAGYNIFLLSGLAFSGWAFSRLAREFVEDRLAVGLASLLFACSPFVLYEAVEGRPTQAILGLLPLFLLQAWRAGSRAGLRAPLLAGLLLALLGYQYWYYAFFAGLSVVGLGAWRLLMPGAEAGGRARILGRHLLMAWLALLLVAPVVLPLLLRTELGGEVPGLYRTDLWGLDAVVPVTAEGHRVGLLSWQPLLGQSGFLLQDSAGAQRFLGHQQLHSLGALILLVFFFSRPGRLDRGGFLALFLGAALLATGPLLLLGGSYLVQPAYLGLAKSLGFLQRLWWPSRAFAVLDVLLLLALAVVLGRSVGAPRAGRAAVAAGLVLAWLSGLGRAGLAPLPAWDATVPAGYRCLAQGEPGAIIELPWGWTQAHLYHQTAHGRPIMGGMLERNPVFSPPEAQALREQNSFVSALLEGAGAAGSTRVTPGDRDRVWDLGYRWVVLQRDAYVPAGGEAELALRTRQRRVQTRLVEILGAPVWADARVWIWPLDPARAGQDVAPCAADPPDPDGEPHELWVPSEPALEGTGAVRPLGERPLRSLFAP